MLFNNSVSIVHVTWRQHVLKSELIRIYTQTVVTYFASPGIRF